MATEPTVIRRYTPPTCSLEIAAEQSPLSRWMGKVALKDLRFKLSFDDPRITDDRWLTLRGDRQQLDDLNEAINQYVQSFLSQPEASLGATTTAIAAPANASGISLEPKGLLSHHLRLGTLANETAGESVTLSATQLADLSSALDEYSAEATSIPNLQRKSIGNLVGLNTNWGAIAAGLLLTVGVGVSIVKGLDRPATNTTASAPASSSDQRMPFDPPPNPTPTPLPPGLSPIATLPTPGGLPTSGGNTTINSPNAPSIANSGTNTPGTNSTGTAGTTNAPTIGNSNTAKTPENGGQITIAEVPEAGQANSAASTPSAAESNADQAAPEPPATAAPVPPIAAMDGRMRAAAAQRQEMAKDLKQMETAVAAKPLDNDRASAVRNYFQQRWSKQDDLPSGSSVQYDLEIGADGTVVSNTPRNEAATKLLNTPGMPQAGQLIAPPGKSNSTVTVILGQDGTVQAIAN
jgi:hypothetical protein